MRISHEQKMSTLDNIQLLSKFFFYRQRFLSKLLTYPLHVCVFTTNVCLDDYVFLSAPTKFGYILSKSKLLIKTLFQIMG